MALGASVVALLAAMGAPASAFSAYWQIGGSVPNAGLATALSAVFPLLGLGALVAGGRGRWKRQVLVVVAGLGTCGAAVAWVVLSGPSYPDFLSNAEGASPGGVTVSACISVAAALVMIIADAISWCHGAEKRDLAQRV